MLYINSDIKLADRVIALQGQLNRSIKKNENLYNFKKSNFMCLSVMICFKHVILIFI